MDKKQQIVNLWRTCFGDSEAFISLYFDRVYKDENAMTIEKDGKIVSALQIVPYTMTYLGTEISVAYISGVCTAPEERGQGLMRQLLQETFEEMERREVAISALIPADPWLFDPRERLILPFVCNMIFKSPRITSDTIRIFKRVKKIYLLNLNIVFYCFSMK